MKCNKENPGKILDQAIEGIRNSSASPEQVEQASANVRRRLQEEFHKVVPHPSSSEVDRIQSCEDFRALIPAYLTASLTPSRRLLFEDHIRECVGCRKALEAARRGTSSVSTHPVPRVRRISGRGVKWIAPIAAVLLAAVALQTTMVRDLLWPIDVHATVQMVDGGLFSVSGHDVRPVKAGQRIERGQAVLTGNGSGAMLELADGTRIELASRSELSLTRARDGVKVRLARGNVIVSAAKQHGHLYVETHDLTVTVVGTVFSVSAGIKGSRVAVIEGEVEVLEEGGEEESLLPGEQLYTNPEMGEVAIEEEIGWSRNAEAMLKELLSFGQDFASKTERQSMRHSSNLVALVPADTLVFASLPNVSQPFKESYALFRRRISDNTVLASWWQQNEQPGALNMDQLANLITDVGAYLGDEVVIAFPKESVGRRSLLLAETARTEDLVSSLSNDLERLQQTEGTSIRLARNASELSAMSGAGLVLYVENGVMMASDASSVQRTAAVLRGTLANTFSSTPLYRRLEQAYAEGVGWVLAVDLQPLESGDEEAVRQLGFDNVQQLVLEQKTGVGNAASKVALGFSDERRGLPAWLGAPAPMGALDFVSPNAYGFSAWITKDPELILDDILGLTEGENPASVQLREFEASHGIDVRRDLAEPLGNEALVAIDGPLLPTPSWKVVFEVNDAPKLENTIQWAVTNINRDALVEGRPTWNLESETIDGKTYHALKSMGSPVEIHYTAWMGYMILTPSRALLIEAINIRDSGNSINRSSAFLAQLPPDGRDVASAIMYQNFEAMAQSIPSLATDLSRDVRETLQAAVLFKSALPKVVFVYGEPDRILGTAKGSHGIQIASMLGLHSLLDAAGMNGLWQH